MLDLRLAVDLVTSLLGAAISAVVGLILWTRARDPRAEPEVPPFAWGWMALAVEQAAIALADAFVAAGVSAMWPFRIAYLLILGGMAVALGAFLVHAFRLLSARPPRARWGWLAGSTYFVFFGVLAMLGMTEASIREPGLSIDLPRASPTLVGFIMIAVIAPLLLPVLSYLVVIARGTGGTLGGRSARYRAVLIVCCFLLAAYASFGISLSSLLAEGSEFELGFLVVSLVAPLGVLLAYRPPAAIQDALVVAPPQPRGSLFEE